MASVPNVIWPYTAEVNPNRLAAKFLRLNQYENEFAQLAGENYSKWMGDQVHTMDDSENPRPTGAMIEVFQDLKAGGTELRIPVVTPPTGMPKFGDADVSTEGVTAGIVYRRAEVNQVIYTYDLIKNMQQQIVGLAGAQQINMGAEYLRYLWTQYTDKDLYHTVLNGVSMSLTAMSGITGARTTLTPHSHGNFFALNSGTVTKAGFGAGRPGTAGYETTVNGVLNAVTLTDSFSVKTIEDLEYEANQLKIPYFQTRAGQYRVLIVSDSQLKQLRRDAEFREALISGGSGLGFEGPVFKNFQARWSKTLVFSSPKAFGVQGVQGAVTNHGGSYNGMPKYGPSTVYTDVSALDNNDIKIAIMVGPSMITKAYGINPISFTGWVNEAQGIQLLIMRSISAYVLSDIYDLDGLQGLTAGDWHSNTSSLVCATYSPTSASA